MTSQQIAIHSLDLPKETFSRVVALPKDSDWHSVRDRTMDGWDSLAHMQLAAELENQFNVLLSTDEVIDLSTFEKGPANARGAWNWL